MEYKSRDTSDAETPIDDNDISLHEYYAIAGLVRRVGRRATHFIQTPRRMMDRVTNFLD